MDLASHESDDGPKYSGVKYGSIKVDDGIDLKEESVKSVDAPTNPGSSYWKNCLSKTNTHWSNLVFGWFNDLLVVGNSKAQLDPSDLNLLPLPKRVTTNYTHSIFEKEWEKEKRKANEDAMKAKQFSNSSKNKKKKTPSEPSLSKALFHSYGADFLRAGVLKLFHDCLIFVGPQVLNRMILYLREDAIDLAYGLTLTISVTLAQLTMSFCLRHYFYRCYITGLQVRTAIVISVYKKALFLAAGERQTRSVGEITNLISIDAKRLQDLTAYLHAVWYSFVQISLAIFFLWKQLGASCLAGVAVILIMMPVTKKVARFMGTMQKKLMKAKDARIEANSEVLQSMKVIKLQAWEKSFQAKLELLRENELKQLLYYVLFNALTMMLWTAVPLLVAVATFAAYVISGNELGVANALTSLALFEILRFPLFMLPQIINRLVEANISIKRIRSFLLCDDHIPISAGTIDDAGVQIKQASFVYESRKYEGIDTDLHKLSKSDKELIDSNWQIQLLKAQLADAESEIKELLMVDESNHAPMSEESYGALDENVEQREEMESGSLLSLRRVNFECKRGEFIVVVGPVGSGKSTFINSILGEINSLSGSVNVKGSMAYFSQSAFILNETVKANIIFGHKDESFNASKYQSAIETCALTHDLSMLPNGDMTEIGEKGITLSGGQKARVAMARTVYHDADIYLLDDPLAAVDAHVGRHMFQKCIVEELLLGGKKEEPGVEKSRTVIFVTNALQYLNNPLIDKILVLKDGLIKESGSYQDLTQDPKSLLCSYLTAFQESLSENDKEELEEDEIKVDEVDVTEAVDPTDDAEDKVKQTEKFDRVVSFSSSTKSFRQESFNKGALMTDEFVEREVGNVSSKIYLSWANAAGGSWVAFAIFFMFLFVEGVNVMGKWWLTYWGQHTGERSQTYFLGIYAAINLFAVVTQFFRITFVMYCGLKASRTLYTRLLESILKAPMSFFDTTPVGRIINRFSKDIYTADEELVQTLRSYLATLTTVIGVVVVIATVQPIFTLFLVPITLFYLTQQNHFNKTYRELKRLDSVARSPIYALLGETLDGVSSIRAFNAQGYLMNRITEMLDVQQNAYYLTFTGQCWLAVRLELVGTIIISFACLCAVIEHVRYGGNEAFAGLAGLAISFSLSVTQSLNWSVRMASDLEAAMVAVERIEQYCNLPSEAARVTYLDETGAVPVDWPREGKIVFKNAKLRYRKGLPLVLKGLDLVIPARSSVGVVGRTGAGKSTLMVALMRIVELDEGYIYIDDVEIKQLGLTRVRSKIAVIPQDPVLFSGSVRVNLDPFDECDDDKLYEVLRRVGLFSNPSSSSLVDLSGSQSNLLAPIRSLNDTVLEGGQNFSAGQRQLLVIARALLSKANIVIMDEATAAIDADTDSKIQKLMREDFANSTCITIAHRLNTIMDSDFILMMDDGRAAEFDTPKNLLSKDGKFKDLVTAWEEEH